jgi:mannonate dehydratase
MPDSSSQAKRYPLRAVPGFFGNHPGIQIGTTVSPLADDAKLQQLQQLGAEWAMLNVTDQSLHSVANYKNWIERFARFDIQIYRICNHSLHNMEAVTLNLEDFDRKTEEFITFIRNLGEAGVYYNTYAHMATGIWSSDSTLGRGGLKARTLDLSNARGYWDEKEFEGDLPHGRCYTEDELWDNYERFMRKVVPAAEEAGVYIGMHPDDPPVYALGGVPRCILGNFTGYQRALEIANSPNIGVCLCVGCWLEGGAVGMGVDVLEAIHAFGKQGKLFKVHFRNVTNPMPEPWRETMMDEGYMDMTRVMSALQEVEFDGCIIPDHIPQMSGDGGLQAGLGYSIGYMRALANANLRMSTAD